MFWNKKESDKELPDLPPMKSAIGTGFDISQLNPPEEPVEKQGLPSFPDSPIQKGFSQTAIKEAVSQPESLEENEQIPSSQEQEEQVSTPSSKIKTVEMEEWTPQEQQEEKPKESQEDVSDDDSPLEEPPVRIARLPAPVPERKEERPERRTGSEIFVKIEKFNSARRSLESVKQRLNDVEVLLKKIRDVKMREEQELASWEKELAAAKSRIQDVSDNIFGG
jgi:hypothetical protein